jgi:hypothetical protein
MVWNSTLIVPPTVWTICHNTCLVPRNCEKEKSEFFQSVSIRSGNENKKFLMTAK